MSEEQTPDKILISREDLEDLAREASNGEWTLAVLGSAEHPVVTLVEWDKADRGGR